LNGVVVIRALLTGDTALGALVPDDSIVAGALPAGTELNAISIEHISRVDRNVPLPGVRRRVRERVQVTALGKTYPQLSAILKAVRAAAADHIGNIAGLEDVTVHTDLEGPDGMDEDASIYTRSQDFMVGFNEPR
jgi:hypothetical protein